MSAVYVCFYDTSCIVHWLHLDVDKIAAAGSALIDLGMAWGQAARGLVLCAETCIVHLAL